MFINSIALNIAAQATTITTFFIIAIVVGSESLGHYAILSAMAAIIASFVSLSIENSLLRLKVEDTSEISDTLLLLVQVIIPILSISIVILLSAKVNYVGYVAAMTLNLAAKKTINCVNVMKGDLTKIYVNNLLMSLPPLLGLVFYHLAGSSLTGFLSVLAASSALLNLKYWASTFQGVTVNRFVSFSYLDIKGRLIAQKDFILFNTGSNLVQSVSLHLLTIILGYGFSNEMAASYALANRGLVITSSVIAAVVSHRLQVEYRQGNLGQNKLDKTLASMLLIGAAICVLATIYTLFIHDYVFGDKYVEFSTIVFALFPAMLATLVFSPISAVLTIMAKNSLIFAQKTVYVAALAYLFFVGADSTILIFSLGFLSFFTGSIVYLYVRKKL